MRTVRLPTARRKLTGFVRLCQSAHDICSAHKGLPRRAVVDGPPFPGKHFDRGREDRRGARSVGTINRLVQRNALPSRRRIRGICAFADTFLDLPGTGDYFRGIHKTGCTLTFRGRGSGDGGVAGGRREVKLGRICERAGGWGKRVGRGRGRVNLSCEFLELRPPRPPRRYAYRWCCHGLVVLLVAVSLHLWQCRVPSRT